MTAQPLTDVEASDIESNLFRLARPLVRHDPAFPWHRDRSGAVTASRVISSQALAIDLFVGLRGLESWDAIARAWLDHLNLPIQGPWTVELERKLPASLLGEPRSSQIDAVLESQSGLVLFECKFTEPDGGACSQPEPIVGGANAGLRQCNGNYQPQTNPVNGRSAACSLTGKRIRYWDWIPQVFNIDPSLDAVPCPFAGGAYQWMRNLVAAAAYSNANGSRAAFVLLYADGPFAVPAKLRGVEWQQFLSLLRPGVIALRTVSYQQLLAWAIDAAGASERGTVAEMREWILHKIKVASSAG